MKESLEPIKCTYCSVKNNTIFRHLTKQESDFLEEYKTCRFYSKGSIIYNEGSKINGVYCVNNGILKIFKTGIDCKEQIVAFAKKGNIIGYRSTISGELACTTAKVLEDAEICYIPGEVIFKIVKSNGSFALDLLQLTCKELGEANDFITDIAQKTVRERLAEVLLQLNSDFGTDSSGNIAINLTREELANIVGTATESIIRLLSEFKHDRMIEINARKIKLINIQALERISNVFG